MLSSSSYFIMTVVDQGQSRLLRRTMVRAGTEAGRRGREGPRYKYYLA